MNASLYLSFKIFVSLFLFVTFSQGAFIFFPTRPVLGLLRGERRGADDLLTRNGNFPRDSEGRKHGQWRGKRKFLDSLVKIFTLLSWYSTKTLTLLGHSLSNTS